MVSARAPWPELTVNLSDLVSVLRSIICHMRTLSLSGLILGVVFTAFTVACDVGTGEMQNLTRSVELDKADSVDVELAMGAGELSVTGGAAKLMEAGFHFNVPSWEPLVDYQGGVRGNLRVRQPNSAAAFGHTENRWDLRLNDRVPIDLTARLGAGEATLVLGTLNLRSLEIHEGAGELRLDLRGTPKQSYDVRINGGVGRARIQVPRSAGVFATATGGIGSINIEGLQKRGDTWYNPDHEKDPIAIHLDVKGGVGEINVSAE